MSWAGYLGLVMIGLAVLAVAFGVLSVLPAALRFKRQALETRRMVELYRQSVSVEMLLRDELAAERHILLRRLHGVRRVLGHPLTIALAESMVRRRRRARALRGNLP